ncbi:MAG TPA: energy transducer TonB [Gemmatimonadaceae bacterium]|nr:energy transducer TonB [Gemmatimonadaceae bacterium]
MFTRLIESRRRGERRPGVTAASVMAHAAVIALAVHATARGAAAPREIIIPEGIIYHVPAPDAGASGPDHPAAHRCDVCAPAMPHPTISIDVPTVPGPEIPAADPLAGLPGTAVASTPGAATGDTSRDGGTGWTERPDEPARALAGNPPPAYPALLRSMRVGGRVAVSFIIDTTGRVDPPSIAFAAGTDALFATSVRQALLASRYTPARTNGRVVRNLVRQEFVFEMH